VKILIDMQCWLWLQASPGRFSVATLRLLADPDTEILLSVASSWEIAIKYALGKLALPEPPVAYVPSRLASSGTRGLPIQHAHAVHAGALPPHHRDPFDRLLIAQAQLEQLTLLSADRQLAAYDVDLRVP